MCQEISLFLENENQTLDLGSTVAKLCPDTLFTLFLEGELGAGKTTFTRGFLHGLGYSGKVKSPTYTLVEQYSLGQREIFHFDLYRLADPEELDFLGLDDFFVEHNICIVEWAQRGYPILHKADLSLNFSYQDKARRVVISAQSEQGEQICEILHNNFKL